MHRKKTKHFDRNCDKMEQKVFVHDSVIVQDFFYSQGKCVVRINIQFARLPIIIQVVRFSPEFLKYCISLKILFTKKKLKKNE